VRKRSRLGNLVRFAPLSSVEGVATLRRRSAAGPRQQQHCNQAQRRHTRDRRVCYQMLLHTAAGGRVPFAERFDRLFDSRLQYKYFSVVTSD
jgi:hypothetical protein